MYLYYSSLNTPPKKRQLEQWYEPTVRRTDYLNVLFRINLLVLHCHKMLKRRVKFWALCTSASNIIVTSDFFQNFVIIFRNHYNMVGGLPGAVLYVIINVNCCV